MQPLRSLYSYSLYSFGLYGYGLSSYGLYSYGPYANSNDVRTVAKSRQSVSSGTYIGMAHAVAAYIVTAHIVMAYIVTTYIVTAYMPSWMYALWLKRECWCREPSTAIVPWFRSRHPLLLAALSAILPARQILVRSVVIIIVDAKIPY